MAYLGIFLSNHIWVTIACYFLVGLCAGGRVGISIPYMNEFIPEGNQNMVTTLLNCHDASIMII